MALPDIPVDSWQSFQADEFSANADQRINSLTFSTAANSRIAQLDQVYAPAAPTPSSDSLTNPLGTGNNGAGPKTETPPTVSPTAPSPAEPSFPSQPAPALPTPDAPPQWNAPLPAPDAPAPTDFGVHADTRIDSLAPSPADSGAAVPPQSPPSSGGFTTTTAGLSGGGSRADARITGDAPFILSAGGDLSSWLGQDGQKAVQSVLVTEGGMNKARGDSGKSAGPLQFYEEGQLANYARARNVSLQQAKQLVEDNPLDALQWAIGTPDKPGYLGAAVQRGIQMGLSGADLATYVQRTGQVSVSPERAGQNYRSLFSDNSAAPYTISSGPALNQDTLTPGFSATEQPGGSRAPVNDISQFGDSQLTSDEAYAACGPAAAVRFAQWYGRNPTLREATDLAAQVGWTKDTGMAGLQSEKALMDKLQIPTKLVDGPQWDVFAKEAQTGNPVTISTQGHYFTADGFDPNTGKFHVGRSGLDLRGGAEWMSPAQMTALMGQVQGGLLADSPQVPAPSTADQDTNPLAWLGRTKDAIGSAFSGAASAVGDAVSSLVAPSPQPMTAAMQPTPSDALTNPLGTGNGPQDSARVTGQPAGGIAPAQSTVLDAVGPVVSDLMNAAPPGSILRGGLNAANAAIPATDSSTAPTMPTGGQLFRRAEEQKNAAIAAKNPLRDVPVVGGATTMAAQILSDPLTYVAGGPLEAGAKEVIARTGLKETPELVQAVVKNLTQGAGWGAIQGVEDPNATLGSVATSAAEGAALGAGVSVAARGIGAAARTPAVRAFTADESGALRIPGTNAPTTPAYTSVMPAGTFQAPKPAPAGVPLSSKIEGVTNWITQHFTDRDVSLARMQQEYQRVLGRPLNADEMAYELKRMAADPAAAVRIDEGLKPAIQSVGDDYNALRDYVTLRSNVQVAEGAGTKVQAAGMTREVPVGLRSDLNAANTSLRMRQQVLDQLQNASVPEPDRIQLAQRGVNSAQRAIQRRQDAIAAWQQSNTQAASTAGAEAALNRKFSGGLTRDDSIARMQQLEQQLGPDRFQNIKTAADQISQFSRDLRQRLIDSDVLSREQADQLDALYPDWAKTRVLDYMKDPAGGQAAGTKIGLADRGLREYSIQGTEKAREDPLASMVAYTHQVERMATKNDTFNALLTIDRASPQPMLRKVAQDFSPTKDQVTIVGFENGEKVKYVTDNKALGEAINGTSILPVPEWTKAWGQLFRSFATSRNPLFLAGNAALDIPTYVMRESVRAGGPQHLPAILGELAKGYVDAFQGLLQGEFRGNTARLIKGGGGSGSYAVASESQAAQGLADLQRRNVFQINGRADLLRLAKDLVTLQPVESIGQRIEYGPRTASFRLAEKRGANQTQAVINGRTVTVDFSQGGDVTKYVNNFIPFFNVGFQGSAQIARSFRENPGAFVWTVGTLLGGPAIAAEAWNRSDPQRAKDYADVPQYVKDQGVVVMLPGNVPVDPQGNRKPLYAVVKLREWAPFASLARDAAARVLGDDTKSWQEVAGSAARGFSPTQASSVGQLGTEALSGIPVLPAAAQIQYNKDFFRGRDVVTQRNDQSASAAAKALTPAIQKAVDQIGLGAEVRPSAVEFFIRNQAAGVGAAVLGASDLAAGTPQRGTGPTSLPLVGGLAGRFIGNQTGDALQQARDASLTQSARQILRENGITSTPGPIGSTAHGIPLRQDEETQAQQLANRYVDEAIHRTTAAADWGRLPQIGKQARMDAAIQAARARAEGEVLSSLPQSVRQQRQRVGTSAP